jgi:hypothetical protein
MKDKIRPSVTSVTSVTGFSIIELYARARVSDQRKKASRSSQSSQAPVSLHGQPGPLRPARLKIQARCRLARAALA